MNATTAPRTLPFELAGDVRSFGGLTILPLFPAEEPQLEYVGLDEAAAAGLTVREIDEAGAVGSLSVSNPLRERVLLYEGEELAGGKQHRVLERTILVEACSQLEVPVACVERGRWSDRSRRFAPAPRAAYPELRRAKLLGQAAVWASVAAKQAKLGTRSPTEAIEDVYVSFGRRLDEYVAPFPRLDGQSGAAVAIGGRVGCLDYVSRSDVWAGLYPKLLRGYALDALEAGVDAGPPPERMARFLKSYFEARRARRPRVGLGEESALETPLAVGSELRVGDELVALTLLPREEA